MSVTSSEMPQNELRANGAALGSLHLELCPTETIHWTVFRSTDEETTRMEQKVIVESLLPAHGFEIWGFKFSRMNIISPWRGQMGKPETQGSLHLRYQVNRRMNRHSAREIICVFRSLSLNFRKVRLSCNIVGSQSRGIIGSEIRCDASQGRGAMRS